MKFAVTDDSSLRLRHRLSRVFELVCRIATWGALLVLVVLLVSIAGRVSYQGNIKAYVEADDAPEEVLAQIEKIFNEHPLVASVERKQDQDDTRFYINPIDQTADAKASWAKLLPLLKKADASTVEVRSKTVGNQNGLFEVSEWYQYRTKVDRAAGDVLSAGMVIDRDSNGRLNEEDLILSNLEIRDQLDEKCREIKNWEITIISSESIEGWSWKFLTNYTSQNTPQHAGILAGVWGSIWLVLLTAIFAVPVGIGAAIYLEEYASDTLTTRLIKLNLSNLAGVPSIVYGILGAGVFLNFFGTSLHAPITGTQLLPMRQSLLPGSLTLALLILPVIIVATQEGLKSVPGSIRSASFALGATKWQTIRHQTLPAGMPGIATGVILGMSRALGETAPIVVIGVLAYTNSCPGGIESITDMTPENIAKMPFEQFSTIPILIYEWAKHSQPEMRALAARGILVLLVILLCVNSAAIYVRNKFQKNLNW